MKMEEIGYWAFILGVVVAVVGPFIESFLGAAYLAYLLVVLGVVVGLLNITEKEVSEFLLVVVALLLAGAAGLDKLPVIGQSILKPILSSVGVFVAPAAVVVALKVLYSRIKILRK